ncbi:ABC transporter ATP-binding protein [Acetonema longum]|uniref:Oligopeptide ABC transporter ATP binding protein n=1 Tax=Acetonema longum DSM 6540 TaxID=1009370 RepID=F7NDF6_9FIRM|nr:ABC transporter ATP-binding protein [Acetonema longum]EGO65909.1 oligopeptide ABC transporter ATP binding protein [Acetonema longum DSM 6540]
MDTILSVENLQVVFHTYAGKVQAVNDVSFSLGKGEIIGIVGESGCGKSVTASSLMGLIPSPPGEIAGGKILFNNKDIAKLPETELQALRGNAISMIFQDPMTSLNPVLSIGLQLAESFMIHQHFGQKDALDKAVEMLRLVGIPAPETRIRQYPHQLSGGMRQRVMIAMALACNPKILIADEPTTALDVTIQAQIVELMKQLNEKLLTSIILISHDLGVVAGLCSRVLVMYAGKIVETASVQDLYAQPMHPYTYGLLRSVPRLDAGQTRLESIGGQPPDLLSPPPGCAYMPRCRYAMEICHQPPPLLPTGLERQSRCWLSHEMSLRKPESLFSAAKEGDPA